MPELGEYLVDPSLTDSTSTPSAKDNVHPAMEKELRIFGSEVILNAAVLLRLDIFTATRAMALFQRFYFHRSLRELSIWRCAQACLLISLKVEENIRPLYDLLRVFETLQTLKMRPVTPQGVVQPSLPTFITLPTKPNEKTKPLEDESIDNPLQKQTPLSSPSPRNAHLEGVEKNVSKSADTAKDTALSPERPEASDASIIQDESFVLQSLGYVVSVEQPHRFVIPFCHALLASRGEEMVFEEEAKKKQKTTHSISPAKKQRNPPSQEKVSGVMFEMRPERTQHKTCWDIQEGSVQKSVTSQEREDSTFLPVSLENVLPCILQRAWNFVTDSFRTTLCCRESAVHVACGAVFLACQSVGLELPLPPVSGLSSGLPSNLLSGTQSDNTVHDLKVPNTVEGSENSMGRDTLDPSLLSNALIGATGNVHCATQPTQDEAASDRGSTLKGGENIEVKTETWTQNEGVCVSDSNVHDMSWCECFSTSPAALHSVIDSLLELYSQLHPSRYFFLESSKSYQKAKDDCLKSRLAHAQLLQKSFRIKQQYLLEEERKKKIQTVIQSRVRKACAQAELVAVDSHSRMFSKKNVN